jgi:hypothetical protein
MIAEQLINPMIPALKKTDKAEKAIVWMEELKTNQLPVIEGRSYLGLISEEDILENNNLDALMSEFRLCAENCYVLENQHMFDVIRISQSCDAELVAILNENREFLGVASYEDTLKAFANSTTIQSQGGILVLSLKHFDYSMGELGRIIEADGGKILGSMVSPHITERDKLYVTLKLNKEDLTAVTASLERFGYQVIAKFHDVDNVENDKERLDNLMKFLDI